MKKFSKIAMTTLLAVTLGSKAFAGTEATGEFTGTRENAYYGYVKVVAVMKNGKLIGTYRTQDVTEDEVLGMIILGKQPADKPQTLRDPR